MARKNEIHLWKRAPFTRLLPPLILGVIAARYFHFTYNFITVTFLAGCALILGFEWLNLRYKYALKPISGIVILILLFICGVFITRFSDIKSRSNWYGHHPGKSDYLVVVLENKPEVRPKSYRIRAKIIHFIQDGSLDPASGICVLYFPKDSMVLNLKKGDELIIRNELKTIENFSDSLVFDYKRHMALQGIYHQAYLKKEAWTFTGRNHLTALDRLMQSSLKYIHHLFESHFRGPNEIALVKALLTGDRSELDKGLVQSYANTGVVHIMAISGLHLGLIYLLLVKLAQIIPMVRRNSFLKLAMILTGIWFFAVLTGCSPSVMRAAVMFSFLSLGVLKKRRVSTYNFWAAAAFILLWFKPLLLFNVGFQLSFLAVLGILAVQRPIYKWFSFQNRITDYLWQLISVSIAAQVFTMPLCLYYFQQFPILFIFANIVAIPLASMGLWLAVVMVMTSWIPPCNYILSPIVENIFSNMNGFVQHMDSFSFSVLRGIHISKADTLMISFILVFGILWLMKKRKIYLKYALAGMVGLATLTVLQKPVSDYHAQTVEVPSHNPTYAIKDNPEFAEETNISSANRLIENE